MELAVLGVAFSPHPHRARALNSFELATGSNVSIGSGAGGAVVGCDGPAASGPGVLASQQRHTLLPRLVLAFLFPMAPVVANAGLAPAPRAP